MWVVNYAAPGVAIAGLGVTYYALMKKGMNLERQNEEYTAYVMDILSKSSSDADGNPGKDIGLTPSRSWEGVSQQQQKSREARQELKKNNHNNFRSRSLTSLKNGFKKIPVSSSTPKCSSPQPRARRKSHLSKSPLPESSYTYLKSKFKSIVPPNASSEGLNSAITNDDEETDEPGRSLGVVRSASAFKSSPISNISTPRSRASLGNIRDKTPLAPRCQKNTENSMTESSSTNSMSSASVGSMPYFTSLDLSREFIGKPSLTPSPRWTASTAQEITQVFSHIQCGKEMSSISSFPTTCSDGIVVHFVDSDFSDQSTDGSNESPSVEILDLMTHVDTNSPLPCNQSMQSLLSIEMIRNDELDAPDQIKVADKIDPSEYMRAGEDIKAQDLIIAAPEINATDLIKDTGEILQADVPELTLEASEDSPEDSGVSESESGSLITVVDSNLEHATSLSVTTNSTTTAPKPSSSPLAAALSPNLEEEIRESVSEVKVDPSSSAHRPCPLLITSSENNPDNTKESDRLSSWLQDSDQKPDQRPEHCGPPEAISSSDAGASTQFLFRPTISRSSISTCVQDSSAINELTVEHRRPRSRSCNFIRIHQLAVEEILRESCEALWTTELLAPLKRAHSLPNVLHLDIRYGQTPGWDIKGGGDADRASGLSILIPIQLFNRKFNLNLTLDVALTLGFLVSLFIITFQIWPWSGQDNHWHW